MGRVKSEQCWRADKKSNGWELPKKTFFLLRLPIARRFRALYHEIHVYGWARSWGRAGIGWGHPSQYDLWVLYAIRRGRC